MASLGTFGAARREVEEVAGTAEPTTFDFCGETFTVQGRIPAMLMLQIGAASTGRVEETEGLVALWEAMRVSLTIPERQQADGETVPADPAAFQRLYRLAVAQAVDLDELMRLAMALFEAQAGRPTERQPDSPDGLPSTSTSSSASSSVHPALQGMTPVAAVLGG
ncbi:hypothetical protein ABT336_00235 [Micromonospora sp. NPDC000207]|uniref:hypothetical protein n=1 Tax=Micromonospora sp. NPDC000207 TaxID=3154246 RepID=UPI00332F27EC